MKEGQRGGARDPGGHGREAGGDEKANDATEVTKREGLAEPPLKQQGHQKGLAGIPGAIEYRGEKFSAGSDGADQHPNEERWTGTRTKRDQNPCGEA
jgi:hypothetical protein